MVVSFYNLIDRLARRQPHFGKVFNVCDQKIWDPRQESFMAPYLPIILSASTRSRHGVSIFCCHWRNKLKYNLHPGMWARPRACVAGESCSHACNRQLLGCWPGLVTGGSSLFQSCSLPCAVSSPREGLLSKRLLEHYLPRLTKYIVSHYNVSICAKQLKWSR